MAKFYAVHNGRKAGIYRTWAECEAQVKGFSGAKFKKFGTEHEAQYFVETGEVPDPSNKPGVQDRREKRAAKKQGATLRCTVQQGQFYWFAHRNKTIIVAGEGRPLPQATPSQNAAAVREQLRIRGLRVANTVLVREAAVDISKLRAVM